MLIIFLIAEVSVLLYFFLLLFTNMNDCGGICNAMHIAGVETVDSDA